MFVYNGRIYQIFVDALGGHLCHTHVLWKVYIDFEVSQEEYGRVRRLYENLLKRTNHIKVRVSLAQFEQNTDSDDRIERARSVFERANKALGNAEKEERVMLLEEWSRFETEFGDETSRAVVEAMMPRRVKKRRQIKTEDGVDASWQEYYDYLFPTDNATTHMSKPSNFFIASAGSFKLLKAARKWKERQIGAEPERDAEERSPERPPSPERQGDSDTDLEGSSSSSSGGDSSSGSSSSSEAE